MDIRFIQSFVTVVDHGSVAEAARRLDLTATAITSRVRALEADLGVRLLTRTGRTIRPTEAGLRILESARAVLRAERDLSALVHEGTEVGELRLGCFVSALTSVLPPVLERLYAVHPQLALFVTPGASVELCRRVAAGELDAAVVVEPQFALTKTCRWHELQAEPLVVIAHSSLAGSDAHELLRREPFIRYERSVLGGQLADRYLRQQGIWPEQRLEIDGLLAIAALVERKLGVSLLPDWSWLWTSGMALARIPLPGLAPVRRIGVLAALNSPRRKLIEAFVDQTYAVFSKSESSRLAGG
jgi:DNA-binding transcriptional LysR family regulator